MSSFRAQRLRQDAHLPSPSALRPASSFSANPTHLRLLRHLLLHPILLSFGKRPHRLPRRRLHDLSLSSSLQIQQSQEQTSPLRNRRRINSLWPNLLLLSTTNQAKEVSVQPQYSRHHVFGRRGGEGEDGEVVERSERDPVQDSRWREGEIGAGEEVDEEVCGYAGGQYPSG